MAMALQSNFRRASKIFHEERTKWGSHRYKNSQIFSYFSFIYQLKESEVRLLTQSGPRPCQSMQPRDMRIALNN